MSLIDARFVLRLLQNCRRERLDRSMIGFSLEQVSGPVTAEMATAYAAATGDSSPCYGEPAGVAPPLLISRLVLPLFRQLVTHPRLGVNLLRMVHAEQRVTWHEPVRIGDRLRLRVAVESIVATKAGDLLQLAGRAYDEATGDLRGEASSGMLIRRRVGKKRSPRPAPDPQATKPQREPQPEPPSELFRAEIPTRPDQALSYAAASGDDNFIHTSPLLARAAGLPGTILQGLCALALTASALTRERLDGDPARLRGLAARFSSYVQPGQTLTLVGLEADQDDRVDFEVLDPRGRRVITQGRCLTR